jgi:CRP-like cAMP-binding protein
MPIDHQQTIKSGSPKIMSSPENIIQFLNQICPLPGEVNDYLIAHLHRRSIGKMEYLSKAGEVHQRMWFIESGLLRGFRVNDGDKEISDWFSIENDVTWSMESFVEQTPSEEYIQALEDTVYWFITREKLYYAYDHFPEMNKLRAILTEYYYIKTIKKFRLREQEASERLNRLDRLFPGLIGRVPTVYLHSYVGISRSAWNWANGKRRGK